MEDKLRKYGEDANRLRHALDKAEVGSDLEHQIILSFLESFAQRLAVQPIPTPQNVLQPSNRSPKTQGEALTFEQWWAKYVESHEEDWSRAKMDVARHAWDAAKGCKSSVKCTWCSGNHYEWDCPKDKQK